jgi:Tfp pilus assembly protein PilF
MQYPKTAPALVPGIYYSWSIKANGDEHSGGGFTVLTDSEASMIKKRLAEIESQSNLGRATRRVLRISYLISQELYSDARERLIEALKADGEEPTLRLLLAEVYEKTGLANLANEQVRVALDLATRGKSQE